MKPIIFNSVMVISILKNMKRNTRRPVKLPKWATSLDDIEIAEDGKIQVVCEKTGCFAEIKAPYQVGDTLYVRETWQSIPDDDGDSYLYFADSENTPFGYDSENKPLYMKWRPSIHMPKEAARIFLKVTDVRVERIQDITTEGAVKEGMTAKGSRIAHDEYPNSNYDFTLEQFETLWDSIYNNWDDNPWVWVIEFERCDARGNRIQKSPPCKIGDKVKATAIRPYNGHEAYIHGEVIKIDQSRELIKVLYDSCRTIEFYYDDFGKTVFVES